MAETVKEELQRKLNGCNDALVEVREKVAKFIVERDLLETRQKDLRTALSVFEPRMPIQDSILAVGTKVLLHGEVCTVVDPGNVHTANTTKQVWLNVPSKGYASRYDMINVKMIPEPECEIELPKPVSVGDF